MTDDVLLSVHGEAKVRVAPDSVTFHIEVRTVGTDKAAVLSDAAEALTALERDLARLDGQRVDPANPDVPLAWAASSTRWYTETLRPDSDDERSDRDVATVSVEIHVRDLGLLDAVNDRLAGHEALEMQHLSWSVDDDNPGWARVRADAIRAALQRARDYAEALGGSVARIEQIADSGLLGGEEHHAVQARALGFQAQSKQSSPRLSAPLMDLRATIDARVIAAVPDLSL